MIKLHGKKFELTLHEQHSKLFKEVFLDDEYWLRTLPTKQIQSIVDVGANAGIFAITARTFFRDAKINCYEPNDELKGFLNANARNFNFSINYSAVGLNPGKGELKDTYGDGSVAYFIENPTGKIPITTLHQIIKDNPKGIDLLKLDCEGYEYELFKAKGIWNDIRYITMEYHSNDLDKVVMILERLGFKILRTFVGPFWIGNILAINNRIN